MSEKVKTGYCLAVVGDVSVAVAVPVLASDLVLLLWIRPQAHLKTHQNTLGSMPP
jgi:hypothetical protein